MRNTGTPPGSFYDPDPMVDEFGDVDMAAAQQDPAAQMGATASHPLASPSGQQDGVGAGGGTRSRSRFNLGLAPEGSRLTNQDFNPAGYRPNESRSTSVGKYGGAPIFSAAIGAPFSVVNDQIRAYSRQNAEIEKAMSEFDPMKGLNESTSVRYKDNINQGAMDAIEGYMANITALHGQEKGLTLMRQKGTAEGMGLQRVVRHQNAIMGSIDDAVNKSIAVTEGMDKGSLQHNEQLYKEAKEVQDKLGSWENKNDNEWLAKNLPAFNSKVSMMDQLKTDGIADILAKAGTTTQLVDLVKRGDRHFQGAFSTLRTTKDVTRDDIVNALTDEYHRQYKNELTRDQVHQMIDGMAANLHEEDLSRHAWPQKTSSSGSGTPSSGGFGAYQYSPVKGPGSNEQKYHQVRLSHLSGGKGKLSAAIPMGDPNSTDKDQDLFLHPYSVFEDESGRLMIQGKVGKEPGASVVTDDNGNTTYFLPVKGKPSEKKQVSEEEYFNKLQNKVVPYDENSGALETLFPGYNEDVFRSIINQGKAANPQEGARKMAPPLSTDGGPTEEQKASPYYTDKSKPPPAPMNATWSEKHGAYLAPKPGGKPNEFIKVRK